MMKYKKEQIAEAIRFWRGKLAKLNESGEDKSLVKHVMLETILEELEIFDWLGSWSDVTGPSIPLVEFPPEAVKMMKEIFGEKAWTRKAIGLRAILSREEFQQRVDDEDFYNGPYEDYVEDEEFQLQKEFEGSGALGKMFKPDRAIAIDGVRLNHDENKTVLAAFFEVS